MFSGRLETCYGAGCFPVKMPQKAKSKNRSISWYLSITYDRCETRTEKTHRRRIGGELSSVKKYGLLVEGVDAEFLLLIKLLLYFYE